MEIYFKLLKEESDEWVRAILGHFIFVYIHPYSDGNGRLGRFIMNLMLASGGYPWTVIRNERREAYMAALEEASMNHAIESLSKFVAEEMAMPAEE
jgi:Fic family protein